MIKQVERILSHNRTKAVQIWLQKRQWALIKLFLGVLVPLYVFGRLAGDVIENEGFFFDKPLLIFAHNLAGPTLNQLMVTVSRVGYAWGVIPVDALVLVFFAARRRWPEAIFWALAVGGAALLNLVAKLLFGRIRPDLWLSIAPETSYSFPSGHAMGSMALVAALLALTWRTRWRWPIALVGGAFVLAVSFSRIYLGVHYPSDILAGWMASLAWVAGVHLLWRRRFAGGIAGSIATGIDRADVQHELQHNAARSTARNAASVEALTSNDRALERDSPPHQE